MNKKLVTRIFAFFLVLVMVLVLVTPVLISTIHFTKLVLVIFQCQH